VIVWLHNSAPSSADGLGLNRRRQDKNGHGDSLAIVNPKEISMRFLRVGVLGLLLLVLASLTWSQTGTSTIRGTITDPQGRVVADANVTLTNAGTNAMRTTKSTEAGVYVFDLITPGDYKVEVDARGFKKQSTGGIHALIGKPTDIPIQMEVGTTSEVVEVTSSSQEVLVNTQDATLGNNFINQQITQLPLESRNLVDLLSLQPGSTREGYVTGARADQANVTLDGVDINNAQTGNAEIPRQTNGLQIGALDSDRGNITSGPVLRLNAEAIDEFRVTTANGNANQGRSSGSQVNLVTKSGSNSWHGAGFEFYRSRGFEANNWFNLHADPVVPREQLERHTFGGAAGGPIVKSRAFFFYSYERRHDSSAQTTATFVPLANLGQGIINYQWCPDSTCSAVNTSQITVSPSSPGPYTAAGINAPTPVTLNSHVAKFDFNLTSKQTAFARLNVIYDHQTLPQWLPDTPSPLVWSHPWGLAAGHTWTIGNNWVNNFRYGFTRQAFTQGGDSTSNDSDFRFVFQPNTQLHDVSRVTPVHNFTDDVSWIRGKHDIQFGANIRVVNNKRLSFGSAFDYGEMNPSFYSGTGFPIANLLQSYLDSQPSAPGGDPAATDHSCGGDRSGPSVFSCREVRDAGTSLIGRFSEITARFTFAQNGALQPVGTPASRDFATQAYDSYIQDTCKVRPNLTLTLGLRYSLERPVYETQGFETQPTVPLGKFFDQRVAAGRNGTNFTDLISIQKSGPANGGKPMYNWDKNNFQPRVAFAWSLDSQSRSVLRGGYALTNDYFGQALAVDFDIGNALGYTQRYDNHANQFNVTTRLGPQFQAFGQDMRPFVPTAQLPPNPLVFPASATPLDGNSNFGELIQRSLDSNLHAPTEHVWNLTFERQLPKGGVLSLSYIGRKAVGLLVRRDTVAFNNLHDPATGVDWYTAGTALEKLRAAGVPISQVPSMLPSTVNQYFEHMFPAGLAALLNAYEGLPNDPAQNQGGFDESWTNAQAFLGYSSSNVGFFTANDWTDTQAEIDLALASNGLPLRFMQPQYGALSTWGTAGNSNYHALAASFRQRLSSLTLDFNYTWSHSLDDASGLQQETGFGNTQGNGAFIVNPLRQHDNYASSDFDIRHNINADVIWQMPFGRGQAFMNSAGKLTNAIFGNWQLSGIFRWNTGLPTPTSPYDEGQWATNWDVQSNVTPIHPIQSCPSKPKDLSAPKLFGNCNPTAIYQNFRSAYPGETGPRNYIRYPGYVDVDLGVGKVWKMPWNEGHQLQLRWDVFNVANTQRLTGNADFAVAADPGNPANLQTPPSDWSNFTAIQGNPRVMQIGVRYSF
jgi:Carboxypeptidase regulatory-like domain